MQIQKHTLGRDTFATPYYVIQSRQKGPCCMIVAGIHGKEIASIRAAQKLVDLLSKDQLSLTKGKLIIVPIVNKKAYLKRIRGVPDLNRTFPRKANQSAKNSLSEALFQVAQRHRPSWYLDLHEANGLSQKNTKVLGQTLITNPKNANVPSIRRIIKQINRTIDSEDHHFNIRLRELPGSSRTAAARILHANAITVETCWSLKLSTRIHYQKDMVCRFLKKAGILE